MPMYLSDSIQGKPNRPNQDFCDKFIFCNTPRGGVILADGIGSKTYAGQSSKFVVEKFKEAIDDFIFKSEADMQGLFSHVNKQFINHIDHNFPHPGIANEFGTTAIVLFESETELCAGYTGNGGIFHLRGNFFKFPSQYILPWSVINNYLNPHSFPDNFGQNSLNKFLPDTCGKKLYASTPSTIRFSKDPQFGDILIAVTDGIYSSDEEVSRVAQFENQEPETIRVPYLPLTPSYKFIIKSLAAYFLSAETVNEEELTKTVSGIIYNLKEKEMIEDDASIGLIITDDFLNFHKMKK